MTRHHPDQAMLLDYASGAASEAESLLVATHLTYCPRCRSEVDELECLGGTLLDSIEPSLPAPSSCDEVLDRLGREPRPTSRPVPPQVLPQFQGLPRPIQRLLAASDRVPAWRRVMAGLDVLDLPARPPEGAGSMVRLMRLQPGVAVPQHTHRGEEFTLVLAGGFSDDTGHYQVGDIASCDGSISHRPAADLGEPCVSLVVTTGPVRLASPIGRLASLFVRV
ncbi:MAG: cupin domain-containing protein [Alphaproteobacteria bacterium]|nr:cupin domain-containing protein [Alphaproteobacteria bacterium]